MYYLFMVVILSVLCGQTIGNTDKQFCQAHFQDKLERFLCFAGRTLLKQHPVGKFSLHILDQYFGTGGDSNNKPNPWDLVKVEVEKLVNDKFVAYQIKTLQIWHKSISARVASCKLKVDLAIKRSCYKNLQEDMAGFEPVFSGTSPKEKIMFLKYYDIYVATFMSVSFLLRDISTDTLRRSIERDIKHKAKIFANHLAEILPKARAHACRHIKIKIIESYLFWDEERLLWPKDEEITQYTKSNVDVLYVANALINQTDGNDKCGFLDTVNTYTANIIDTRDGTEYPSGKTRARYCKNSLAIQGLIPTKFLYWKTFIKMCTDDLDHLSIGETQERLVFLKTLYK